MGMGQGLVFTAEMGARLRALRERAGLTQGEVVRRMGPRNLNNKAWISSLEAGRVKWPAMATVVMYLRACGAVMGEFFDRFNALPAVALDVQALDRTKLGAEARQRVKRAATRQAEKWQRRVVLGTTGKPLEQERARRGAARYGQYAVEVKAVEAAVRKALETAQVKYYEYLGYMSFARSVFSVIRKELNHREHREHGEDNPEEANRRERRERREDEGEVKEQRAKSKEQNRLDEKLAEKWEFVERQGLSPEVARKVQGIVMEVWERISGRA